MQKRKDIKIAEVKLLHRNIPIVLKSKIKEAAKETDHIYVIVFQCSATAATFISNDLILNDYFLHQITH